jgi:arylsulfatase
MWMSDEQWTGDETSRREFFRVAGMSTAALALGPGAAGGASQATDAGSAGTTPAHAGPFNILFILTDQERFFRPGELPAGFRLPAHERLMARGTTFVNHRINSCVCTPSRSVIYTGMHIQQTGMFDNSNFPWIKSMSPEIRTVGDMLRDAGYYTAYKGKGHLHKEFETVNKLGSPTKIFTQEMED